MKNEAENSSKRWKDISKRMLLKSRKKLKVSDLGQKPLSLKLHPV